MLFSRYLSTLDTTYARIASIPTLYIMLVIKTYTRQVINGNSTVDV